MKQVYQQLNKYRGNGMFFTHALRGRVLNWGLALKCEKIIPIFFNMPGASLKGETVGKQSFTFCIIQLN